MRKKSYMGYSEPASLCPRSEGNLRVLGRSRVPVAVLLHVVLELAIQIRLREIVTVTQSVVPVQ